MIPGPPSRFVPPAAAAHGLLRLTLGVALLMHGLVRIHAGLAVFADHLVSQFSDKHPLLPSALVRGFGYALPFTEAVLGGLLVAGLLSFPTLILTALWMVVLVFGSCTIQDWSAVAVQLDYALVVALLLAGLPLDRWSFDALLRRRTPDR